MHSGERSERRAGCRVEPCPPEAFHEERSKLNWTLLWRQNPASLSAAVVGVNPGGAMGPNHLIPGRGLRFVGWVVGGAGLLIVAGPGLNSHGGAETVWWLSLGMGLLLAGSIIGWLGTRWR
ncbi:hypothetical protein VT03_22135 [Planctomyces sp. SH-PL14]|nr:hypothetical protein VT03_22135 [Planctomyces sp. SH-PL14]